ncbi:hypothetical protein JRQ81_010055 [Phrynocephalus forsythii]|uniref:Growth hormone/erythropoietin receptor ligand binding domain-containing protein n=1 Tax=Phrynocephalus forsythii TaxID=171643 RepID=A0A9Q0X7X5_9SAUR|nr:hypothetical protein JRQ81_010055 [Phrynocephalus forsythii]
MGSCGSLWPKWRWLGVGKGKGKGASPALEGPRWLLNRVLPPLFPDVPPKDTQPSCYTDGASGLVCCWEADPLANCTEVFQLRYRISASRLGNTQECPLQSERGPRAASWCTCAIPTTVFRNAQYHFVLERTTAQNKTIAWQATKDAWNLEVKPRRLVNLTVAKRSRSFLLTWKMDYEVNNILYITKRNYEVAYWPRGQQGKLHKCPGRDQVCCSSGCWTPDREPPCPAKIKPFADISSSYEIYADQLVPGSEYMASVRYRLELWGNLWSEWSSPCSWHNDLELGSEHWQDIIPWVCVPVVAAILACYLCLGRLKKWQDSIPHPIVVTAGEQISSPIFQRKERKSFLHSVKALLCYLCNRSGRGSQGRRSPVPAQMAQEKVRKKGTPAGREQVLCPETPLIAPSPIVYNCGTGTEPPTGPEERLGRLHLPHADAVASLFSNAVSDGLGSGASTGLEVWPEDREEPWGDCPLQAPENTPRVPVFLPKAGLDAHHAQDGRATREASPVPGNQSSRVEAPVASAQVASPAPKQGPRCGPPASEEVPQSLLAPHKPPTAQGGAVFHQCASLGPDGQTGGIPPTSSGYKSFCSLSQATTPEAWAEGPFLPGGDQAQLPGSGAGGSHHHPHVHRSLGHGSLQSTLQGRQDLPWVSPGQVALATPLQADSCQDTPGGTSHPPALPLPGYRSLASLLLRNGTEGMYPSGLDLESPYKPLLTIMRSGPTEPPTPGGGILLGPGLPGKTTGVPAWPAVLWEASLDLSTRAELVADDLAGDNGLDCT